MNNYISFQSGDYIEEKYFLFLVGGFVGCIKLVVSRFEKNLL